MRKLCFILLALVPVSAVCQVTVQTVHTECPVKATRITPRVYAFRIYTAGVEGWRPDSKMALDLSVKITGDRGIAAMSFEIATLNNPHNSWGAVLLGHFDNVPINAKPGDQRFINFPANGSKLLDVYSGDGYVAVNVNELRYDNGEIVDLNACTLGYAPVPPPFKPVKPTSRSPISPVGSDVTPSRVLEEHVMDEQNGWRGPPASIVLTFVVEVDGSPQDIKVNSSTLSAELNQKAIETLRTWNFAPAMLGDKPVATRAEMQFNFGRFPSGAPAVPETGITKGQIPAEVLGCDNGEIYMCMKAGILFEEGRGVMRDYNLARRYFTKACDGNLKDACLALRSINQSCQLGIIYGCK